MKKKQEEQEFEQNKLALIHSSDDSRYVKEFSFYLFSIIYNFLNIQWRVVDSVGEIFIFRIL
jgi:hypothetical protein